MPGCVLQVRGEDFDVDAFLAKSPLKPYHVGHKGDPVKTYKDKPPRALEDSYFCILAGEGDEKCNLPYLVEEVFQYLAKNRSELGVLQAVPGVTSVLLDFGVADKNTYTQCWTFPAKLLRLVGELNMEIMLSVYPMTFGEEDKPVEKPSFWTSFRKLFRPW